MALGVTHSFPWCLCWRFLRTFQPYHFPHGHQTPTHPTDPTVYDSIFLKSFWGVKGGAKDNAPVVCLLDLLDCWLLLTELATDPLTKKLRLRKWTNLPQKVLSHLPTQGFQGGRLRNWEPKVFFLWGTLDNHFLKKTPCKRHGISFPNTNTLRIP